MSTLEILKRALSKRIETKSTQHSQVDSDTDLIEVGVVDSQDVLDVILEVEETSGLQFHPEQLDFEAAITIRKLANAFSSNYGRL